MYSALTLNLLSSRGRWRARETERVVSALTPSFCVSFQDEFPHTLMIRSVEDVENISDTSNLPFHVSSQGTGVGVPWQCIVMSMMRICRCMDYLHLRVPRSWTTRMHSGAKDPSIKCKCLISAVDS
jgi:hypothetical protein